MFWYHQRRDLGIEANTFKTFKEDLGIETKVFNTKSIRSSLYFQYLEGGIEFNTWHSFMLIFTIKAMSVIPDDGCFIHPILWPNYAVNLVQFKIWYAWFFFHPFYFGVDDETKILANIGKNGKKM